MSSNSQSIPVTIITGLLGAGKTTLLRNILQGAHGRKILVIQNEFADEMGIESPVLLGPDGSVIPDMYELPNGCLCCSVRDSLVGTIEAVLAARPNVFSSIVVETSGVADPEKVIQIFWTDGELEGQIYLDGVVTVVDGFRIFDFLRLSQNEAATLLRLEVGDQKNQDILTNLRNLMSSGHKAIETSSRSENQSLAPLAYEAAKQIACASVILLNKCDQLSVAGDPCHIDSITHVLRIFNPQAPIVPCSRAQVSYDKIFNLRTFDLQRLSLEPLESAGSQKPHHHPANNAVQNCFISFVTILKPKHSTGDDLNLSAEKLTEYFLNGSYEPKTPLWSFSSMKSTIGKILWEGFCGDIYRSKALSLCLATNGLVNFVTLQGVGEVFDLDFVCKLTPCFQKMKELGAIQFLNDGCISVTSKFLFVGRLKQENLSETLTKSFSCI